MIRYRKYLRYVLHHKACVYEEGVKLGLPRLMLLAHDWDKFKPSNFISYARCFNGPNGERQYVETPEFVRGWKSHQQINKHHYQYWIYVQFKELRRLDKRHCQCLKHRPYSGENILLRKTDIIVWDRGHAECIACGKPFPRKLLKYLPMPHIYRLEMLADWRGAGRAMGKPDTKAWYLANLHNLHLHIVTRVWIELQLGVTFDELAEASKNAH